MNESQKFVFLYFVQSHPRYMDYNNEWTLWSKIPLIKHWRSIFDSGLKEAKDEVESLLYSDYFNAEGYREWYVSKKTEDFIDEMLCIDEIRVETLKWHLLSNGINDSDSVRALYRKVFLIWKE